MIWGWTPVFSSGQMTSLLSLMTARFAWPPWENRRRTISKQGYRINTWLLSLLSFTQATHSIPHWNFQAQRWGKVVNQNLDFRTNLPKPMGNVIHNISIFLQSYCITSFLQYAENLNVWRAMTMTYQRNNSTWKSVTEIITAISVI